MVYFLLKVKNRFFGDGALGFNHDILGSYLGQLLAVFLHRLNIRGALFSNRKEEIARPMFDKLFLSSVLASSRVHVGW